MPKHQFDVEVLPEYLPEQSAPDSGVFSFAYTITITNSGEEPAQLISRHWIISDARGHTEEVKGLGVVGQQPLLKPGESFQYTSGCRLRTASGTMHGTFHCVAEDGCALQHPCAPVCAGSAGPRTFGHPSERTGTPLSAPKDLASLLAALDPAADLAHRHLWLINLLDWVRGKRDSVPASLERVQLFLDTVAARPDTQQRLQAWWSTLVDQVDITTLLADFGFGPAHGPGQRGG